MIRTISKGNNTYWFNDSDNILISDEGGWLPGIYENEKAADLAHANKHLEFLGILSRLQEQANNRGDCVITVDDFKDLTK